MSVEPRPGPHPRRGEQPPPEGTRQGRFRHHPHEAVDRRADIPDGPGPHLIGVGRRGPDLAYLPPVPPAGVRRLVLVLHGAGGDGRQALDLLQPVADEHGLVLLAPTSTASTWDVIRGGFGPDVERLEQRLEQARDWFPGIDVTLAGFSDGASYALSLGLANGDLVDAVVAFSPGFVAPGVRHGSPRCFVSHGRQDPVLPVERCSRRIVPALQAAGLAVTYLEFDGGHVVPTEVVRRAATWLTG
jgi:predicted esterase